MSDAILLATNDTILTDCSRCNVPNHPNCTLNSSNDDNSVTVNVSSNASITEILAIKLLNDNLYNYVELI